MNRSGNTASTYTDADVVRIARHVTWVGFAANATLTILKIAAGVIGKSSAMVADGVHSLSDFVTDLIVIVMIGVSRKKTDRNYQYGYGKYETLATLIIGVALLLVSLNLFVNGLNAVISTIKGTQLGAPSPIALIMAIVSIAVKEWLFRYTAAKGRAINSASVIANAWHHRSDAYSSIATLAGIGGSIFLGSSWRILDPLAAMLVSIFIVITAIKIAKPAIKELLDVALPDEVTAPICNEIKQTKGVITYHHFRSHRNGSKVIIDVHLKVDPEITVDAGHAIASEVETRLQQQFNNSVIANIHIEPYRGEKIYPDGSCND